MSRNETRGPDGYDPVNEMISHVLLALIIAVMFAAAGMVIWICAVRSAHAATARHQPYPYARPHFHYDVQSAYVLSVYGPKMVDDVPYVGFTTDLLRDLRCCHELER